MSSALEFTVTKAAERLRALPEKYRGLMGYTDSNSPDVIEAYLALAKEAAEILDPIFFGIRVEVGLPQLDRHGEPYKMVSSALDGNVADELSTELEHLLRDALDANPDIDPNAEHRLGARELGVGRAA